MKIEGVPAIPMFKNNTAGFVHELPAEAISNVNGDSNYVRVQVLTNAGALNRDQQLAVVEYPERKRRAIARHENEWEQRSWHQAWQRYGFRSRTWTGR